MNETGICLVERNLVEITPLLLTNQQSTFDMECTVGDDNVDRMTGYTGEAGKVLFKATTSNEVAKIGGSW